MHGAATSPPNGAAPHTSSEIAPPGAIKAIVVKSWGIGSGSLVWDFLNANWSLYGSVPIFIDSNTRSQDGRNIVTSYSSGNARATFISYMPEYQNGSQFDATQYLSNAIVCPFPVTPVATSSWGRIKTLYR